MPQRIVVAALVLSVLASAGSALARDRRVDLEPVWVDGLAARGFEARAARSAAEPYRWPGVPEHERQEGAVVLEGSR